MMKKTLLFCVLAMLVVVTFFSCSNSELEEQFENPEELTHIEVVPLEALPEDAYLQLTKIMEQKLETPSENELMERSWSCDMNSGSVGPAVSRIVKCDNGSFFVGNKEWRSRVLTGEGDPRYSSYDDLLGILHGTYHPAGSNPAYYYWYGHYDHSQGNYASSAATWIAGNNDGYGVRVFYEPINFSGNDWHNLRAFVYIPSSEPGYNGPSQWIELSSIWFKQSDF